MHIFLLLVLGGLAGWLASRLVRNGGLGLWGNIGLGVTGAVLGGVLLGNLGVRLVGPFGLWLTALLGSVLLLWVARLLGRK